MRRGLVLFGLLLGGQAGARAQTTDPATRELIERLLARIDTLEKRVSDLERGSPKPAASAVASSPAATSPSVARPSASGAAAATVAPTTPASRSSMLLEALKEEIFQLEVEKTQGKIAQEDYEKAKAALDQTLDRALKRQG